MPKLPIRNPQSLNIEEATQQALRFHQDGNLREAERLYRAVLTLRPDHFDALHLLGVLRAQQGSPQDAVRLISHALERNPHATEALFNLGNAQAALNRHVEAIASYDKALALKPDHAVALNNRGNALQALNRHDEALASFDKALVIKPDHADALSNRGNALQKLNRHDEALASYDQALSIHPNDANALSNRGNALQELNRHEEALASYDKALAISPDHANALNNRGNVLQKLNRHEEALASYDKALAIRPDHAGALNNRGNALLELNRYEEALASYDKSLAIEPSAGGFYHRGNALQSLNRNAEAVESYDRALAIQPDYKYALGQAAQSKSQVCDWRNRDPMEIQLVDGVRSRKLVTTPFQFLAVSHSPADQLTCATSYVQDRFPAVPSSLGKRVRYQHDRIRVAYLSADFHDHATAYLMAGLFEQHDRAKFETLGISFGRRSRGEMRARLMSSFERFVDVRAQSDEEVVVLLRKSEVDIAVDLKGFTENARTGILARRPAPIQVNYLAYPGTMGAEYIDYVVADPFVIPVDSHAFYSEKVVYLPECYQVNDSKRKISEHTLTRAEAGLPEQGFVFCCFNNTYKITPAVFDVWMRLLRQVQGGVLWLLESDPAAKSNLRREAQAREVDPNRLIIAPRLKLEDHLARHRLADVFLDTLPCNAHTTASDALWAGLPVVTCAGSTFAGRVAGSLLHAVGLPELVTYALDDYEALALKLARNEMMLREIKQKLARNRLIKPLFDTDRFRRHIEAAYVTMWERYQRGEPPASFAVQPIDK